MCFISLTCQNACLLADVPTAIIAFEPGAGLADKAIALRIGAAIPIVPAIVVVAVIAVVVGIGIVIAEGRGGDRAGCADGGSGCNGCAPSMTPAATSPGQKAGGPAGSGFPPSTVQTGVKCRRCNRVKPHWPRD